MSDNPLLKKLRLQPGQRAAFINPPGDYVTALGLPETITVTDRLDEPCDFIQLFAVDSGVLADALPAVISALKPDGLLWICYPKTSSGVETDLTRDAGWAAVDAAGLRGVAQVAIDATWSALRFRPVQEPEGGDPIAAQYAGAKAALRPIYDRVAAIVTNWPGVTTHPRQSYVAFVRGKQWAVVQPTTKTRVDIGLKLPGRPFGDRLQEASGTGSGSMTHRVGVTSADEVDDDLIAWLRQAYEGAG